MTSNIIAKWFFYGMIILFPIVLYSIWEMNNKDKEQRKKNNFWRFLISIVSWLAGLAFAHIALSFHQADCREKYKNSPLTEEILLELGDAPNTTATWIIYGWIPIVLISLTAKLYFRREKRRLSVRSE